MVEHCWMLLAQLCYAFCRPFAAGFDVWLPNTRSNTFSRGNYHHSHRDIEYWYHSMDEYALIDNPAMINKALEVSGAKKLAFVGHSQVRLGSQRASRLQHTPLIHGLPGPMHGLSWTSALAMALVQEVCDKHCGTTHHRSPMDGTP